MAVSPLGGRHFVLKGGLLLAQFGARRMTRDIDILGREFPGDDAGEPYARQAANRMIPLPRSPATARPPPLGMVQGLRHDDHPA